VNNQLEVNALETIDAMLEKPRLKMLDKDARLIDNTICGVHNWISFI